ncbi:histidine triad nucleotide-binding protein [Actinotalea sp. M2MS4P-6]|uniref:histidine triad nucleotide-binding protein n=1 Tax=Actinotalea sp. M2MS4P-6 TaxID=2983762 RepID=UPI0021E35DF8|nr:histidine triad nucleotide-binding protein [Actinotalea sp. M2MS4P-6]MCV2393930.1 histidine triad nucleotide-binding protein [Actinotalea sp. M2MS4P-6]
MSPLTAPDCLFCRIVAGEVPAEVVISTDTMVAFRDIAPQAPVHVLVTPRDHHADVAQLAAADPELLADLVRTANEVAEDLADGQFRMIFNTGTRSGQSVFHVHAHVLAGAQLGWSPA